LVCEIHWIKMHCETVKFTVVFRLLLFIYLETYSFTLEMIYNSKCYFFLILIRACLMSVLINLWDSLHMMFYMWFWARLFLQEATWKRRAQKFYKLLLLLLLLLLLCSLHYFHSALFGFASHVRRQTHLVPTRTGWLCPSSAHTTLRFVI